MWIYYLLLFFQYLPSFWISIKDTNAKEVIKYELKKSKQICHRGRGGLGERSINTAIYHVIVNQ